MRECHNHPWEKWTQDDFYGFAAFFARVKIKESLRNDENATITWKRVRSPTQDEAGGRAQVPGWAVETDDPEKDIRESLAHG